MDINVAQLKLIIETKLTIDDRRPITSFARNKNDKASKYSTWLQFFILLVMGIIFLMFIYTIPDIFLASSIFFTMVLSMLSLSFITDFASILLDNKDQYIILPRPVNDKTLAFSRILYMLIKISTQLLALSLPVLIFVFINWNIISSIVFVIQIMLSALIAVFFVNIFYSLCLKFFSIQKFKDFISYIQIFFSIFIFFGYQIGPRVMRNIVEGANGVSSLKLLWFSPGTWIASFQGLLSQDSSLMTVSFSVLSLLLLVVAIKGASQLFSKDFNSRIAQLATGDIVVEGREKHDGSKVPFHKKMEKLFTRNPLEKAGFSIVWLITGRSREFKMQLYPTLGYLPVYFVFLFMQGNGLSLTEKIENIETSGLYIMMFYFSLLTVLTVFQLVTKSEKYKAAWIYYAAPIQYKGQLMSGVLKASFLKYFVPFNLLFLMICIPLFGVDVVNDILLATAIGGVECVLLILFVVKSYPFSQAYQNGKSRALVNILILGILGAVGYVHILLHNYEMLIWMGCVLFWILFLLLIQILKKENWKSLVYEAD